MIDPVTRARVALSYDQQFWMEAMETMGNSFLRLIEEHQAKRGASLGGHELTMARIKIEEAVMWAKKGIAKNS